MLATDIMKSVALFTAWNVFVFSIYFVDKQAARYGRWRVSEGTLLTLAFFCGSIGAVSAQQLLRHKTRKEPFRSILFGITVLHLSIAVLFVCALLAVTLGLL
ncbi:DUF1294 domain-containing protein [Rhizobium sp. Root1220]|uniref:DUF1294 domain-containing protein n=1 Tax=Rhizobium sp. Root1220 TaxID=1736432 RepID=UPI0006FBAA83|nr:DUF1294 domain-containing protein [Rhizobium sp. Root1220]KQV82725.1 hypothetical protein ASC90_23015 [Rhizobium sp. Root1220]